MAEKKQTAYIKSRRVENERLLIYSCKWAAWDWAAHTQSSQPSKLVHPIWCVTLVLLATVSFQSHFDIISLFRHLLIQIHFQCVCVCVCVRVYLRPQKPCVVARHSDHVWRCAVCHISIFSYFISSTMIVFTFNRKWWRCLATFQLINIQTRGLFAVWLNTSQTYDFYTYSQTCFSLQRTLKVHWLWKFSHLKFLLWILSPIPFFFGTVQSFKSIWTHNLCNFFVRLQSFHDIQIEMNETNYVCVGWMCICAWYRSPGIRNGSEPERLRSVLNVYLEETWDADRLKKKVAI